MVSFIPAVLSMCSSGCVLRLQFQRAGLTRGGEGGLQLQLYRLGNAHTRLAAGWCRLHCAGAAAGGRRKNCSRSLQLSTPQVASCELLLSCQPGEGGYSLARPPAPPQVGNIENPHSQSHSLGTVSRCRKFSSLVLLRLLLQLQGLGQAWCCSSGWIFISTKRRLFITVEEST